jgi:hypothetical protein
MCVVVTYVNESLFYIGFVVGLGRCVTFIIDIPSCVTVRDILLRCQANYYTLELHN